MTANRLTLLLFAMVENSGKQTQRSGPKDNIEVKAEAEGNHNSPNIPPSGHPQQIFSFGLT